jgi:hypothetical protein
MTRISREQFVQSNENKSISVEKVKQDSQIKDSVKEDVKKSDLNSDGFVKGDREMGVLFDRIDNYDRNGRRSSIDTTRNGQTTESGQVHSDVTRHAESATTVPQGQADTHTPEGRYQQLLQDNPSLQTNQDLINHFYKEGGRTWNGAQGQAREHGKDIATLARNRSARLERNAAPADPATPSAPADPATPTDPAGPADPATPGVGNSFATENGRVTGAFAQDKRGREAQAESILRANGQWPPEAGRAYAIQIDQDTPPASASHSARNSYLRSYTGQMSVFEMKDGRLQEISDSPYRSASHTGQFRSSLSPNVDGRNGGDIAHIRPGVYNYTTSMHRSNGKRRLNPLDNGEFRNSARDLNHNGVIDGNEVDRNYAATAIQIHEGNANSPSSIGCQTMPPNHFTRFLGDVRSTGGRQFTYVLVRRPNEQYGANPF